MVSHNALKNTKLQRIGFMGFALWLLATSGCGILVGNPEDDKNDPKKNQPENPDDTGTDTGNGPGTPGKTPAISFSITDAPVDDAKHVYITIAKMEILGKEDKWTEIPLKQTTEFDLLALQNGEALKLAELDQLAAGAYTETRLVLAEDKLTRLILADNSEYFVKVPSGAESGLKIKSHFTVEEGKPLAFTIDFDLRKSLFEVGNSDKYHLRPVLRMSADDTSGRVSGAAADKSLACIYEKGTAPDATSACENAISSAKVINGSFRIIAIAEGTYTVRVFTEAAYKDYENVVVKAKEEVTVTP